MSTSGDRTLQLAGPLTVEHVTRLWRDALPKAAGLEGIDLSQASAIDSAGVALVHALRDEIAARRGTPPVLSGRPARYDALCRAHRLEGESNAD